MAIRAARGSLNSGLSVYAGRAPASNLWKSRLSAVSHWPVAGRVVDDQRCVDGDQAFVAGERGDGGLDAGVILRDTDVQQPAVGVDNRDAGLVFLAPCKIEPNEVHRPSLPLPAP